MNNVHHEYVAKHMTYVYHELMAKHKIYVYSKKEKGRKRRQADCPLPQEDNYGGGAPGIQGQGAL